MKSFRTYTTCLLIAAFSYALHAQTTGKQEPVKAVRAFAEQFYGWYVPIAQRENRVPASDIALQKKGSMFASELARALQEDSKAQAKAQEIVGIDFDPFLNSQDPCERYEVGQVLPKGKNYMVEIRSVCNGVRSKKADVIAEVAQSNDKWIFVNFHYPEGGDLMAILKSLRNDRKKITK